MREKRIKYCLLILMSCLAMTSLAKGLYDKYNLSFEKDEIGFDGIPYAWTFTPSKTVSYIISGKVSKATVGSKCLMVDYSNAVSNDKSRTFISRYIPIDPSKNYIYSFFLKTEGKTKNGFGVSIGMWYYDKDKKAIPPKKYNNRWQVKNVGNLAWEKYSMKLFPAPDLKSNDFKPNQIPPKARYVKLIFLSYGYNKKYWIDDMCFEPFSTATGAFAQGDTKIVHAVKAETSVSIDGKLSENIWKDSRNWNSGFVRTVCAPGKALLVTNQTRFKVAHDKKNIYMGIKCNSNNIKNIKSQSRKHNSMSVFSDEDIEVFLDCKGRRKSPIQIVVNASGSFAERYSNRTQSFMVEAASARTPSGWTAEISIPKDRLWQFFTEAGSDVNKYLWNINVCRHQPGEPAQRFSAWNYTGSAGFENRNSLGVLLFAKNKKVLQFRVELTIQQLKNQLQLNKLLLNKSSVLAIQKEQAKILEIKSFLMRLKQLLSTSDVVPDYKFSRYLSEIDAVSGLVNNTFVNLQRLSLAFPKNREKYGYMVYEVPLTAENSSAMFPANGEYKELAMRIAGNEISSKRFAVYTRKELKGIKLKCSLLKNKDGVTIPASNVDLRILKRWGGDERLADILATDERVKLDGYLENYADHERFATNVAANSTKHFLLQLAAKSNVKPGIYKGTIYIEPIGSMATVLPVKVEVLPFKLDETERFVGFFYTGVLHQADKPPITKFSYSNGKASESSMKKELEHISASGFNFIIMGAYANGSFNIDYVSRILKIAKQAGIKRLALLGAEQFITPSFVEKKCDKNSRKYQILDERVAKIAKVAKETGVKLYLYGSDEPKNETGIQRNNIIFEIAKRRGVATMVAIIIDNIRRQIKGLDVPLMSFGAMSAGQSKLLDMVSSKEKVPYKEVVYYGNLFAKHITMIRSIFGWYLIKSHMGGNLPWSYYNNLPNPFVADVPGSASGVSHYVFPTKDRPISTLKFEASREGVNDLRYLEMLKKELNCCKDKLKVKRFKNELDKMLRTFSLLNSKGIDSENYLILPRVYDEYRNKIQDMLIELKKNK